MAIGNETVDEAAEAEERELDSRRDALLRRIANLWRGDWSGTEFDGRDGKRWILAALDGDAGQLAELDRELTETEESYDA